MATKLLTMDEVAESLRVSRRTVQREIAQCRLAAVRVGGQVRIPEAALAAYLEAQTIGQPTRAKRLEGWAGK